MKKTIEDRIFGLNFIWNGHQSPYVEFARYFSRAELWEQLQTILAEGGEGIVITKKGTCYQPGKRPARQTFKVKKELQETIDVVILGANPPTRLYNGIDLMGWTYWEDTKTGEKLKGALYKQYSDGDPIEPVTKTYWNGWAGSVRIGVRKDDKVVEIATQLYCVFKSESNSTERYRSIEDRELLE